MNTRNLAKQLLVAMHLQDKICSVNSGSRNVVPISNLRTLKRFKTFSHVDTEGVCGVTGGHSQFHGWEAAEPLEMEVQQDRPIASVQEYETSVWMEKLERKLSVGKSTHTPAGQ